MATKLILFDIGGVFIEYKNVYKTASQEQNIPIESIDNTFDKYDREITTGKITPQELWIKCITENKLKADPNYNFLHSWLNDYIKIMPTFSLVDRLSTTYSIGLFSNIYKEFVPEMIRQNLLPNITYKHVFLSCDLGIQKPDQIIYEHVSYNSGVKPEEIFFIDDKEENLVPAEKLGWRTLRFKRAAPEESVNELESLLL